MVLGDLFFADCSVSAIKVKPRLYMECVDNKECFLAMLGGLLDGDGSISVYWSTGVGKN